MNKAPELKMGHNLIGGEWAPATETMPAVSPSTGKVFGHLPKGDRSLARQAVEAARKAQKGLGGGVRLGALGPL
jgi:acyl-CoA reductase-like NAD-dependent aldehyde dehydrogenase